MAIERTRNGGTAAAPRPLRWLGISLAAAVAFGLLVVAASSGPKRRYLMYYAVPIIVPVICFFLDRNDRRRDVYRLQWILDGCVLSLSFARAFLPIPFVSGHALFLTYAVFTARSGVARWTATAVLLEVSYIKAFLWHDATLAGGVLLGSFCAWLFRKLKSHVHTHIQTPEGKDLHGNTT